MALKRLTTEEMVQISGPWVTEGSEARQALGRVGELSGILPRVDAAHAELHTTQPSPDNPRLAALMAEAAPVDQRHDAQVRGVHMLLSALALLDGNGARADALLELRDLLLPDGLELTQKTYRAEAGAAALLKTRLDGDVKKRLRAIPVLGHTALYFVEQWMRSAARLGQLEDERASLVAGSGPGDGTKVMAARNRWIRAVNALVANAALADLDEATDRLVFGALRLAEKSADRRARGGASDGEEPVEPPPPAPPGDGPTP